MSAFRIPFVAALLLLPLPALAAFTVAGKPKVEFFAVGNPGALDISAKAEVLNVADDGTTLTFRVPCTAVKTGIDLRDEHMCKNHVQSDTFPDVTLAFPRAAVTWPQDASEAKGKVAAQFTLHGVSQPVEVTYAIKKSKIGYRVTSATFAFDATAHGIPKVIYAGVGVEPKMNAKISNLDLSGE